MALVATAPHEVKGHLVYAANGASPYWLLGKLLVQGHGGFAGDVPVVVDGEEWAVMLTDTDGGLAARPEDPVDGPLKEWQLTARGRGERKVTFEIKPRWAGLEAHDSGDAVSTPFDHDDGPDEGVAVHVQGSNIEPGAYPGLLWEFVQGLAEDCGMAVNGSYFMSPHDWSTIYEYERYVRVRRGMAEKYIRSDGAMRKLLMLCADEKGSKAELKIDNEDVVGYNHRLVLPQQDAARLAPDHSIGKQLKHYHPKHARDEGEDDPLYHPKVGALARQSLNDGAWSWDEHREVRAELEEAILNTLRWSGIPVDPGRTTFVADDHFDVTATDADVTLYDDPTPQIEAEQEALVVRALREMTDSDLDIIETLVADGEGQHYEEVADGSGRAVSTLYRCLDRMRGLVESDGGEVRFGSRKIAQEIRALVESTEHQLRSAADRAARLVTMDQQRAESSAFQRWLHEYAVEVSESMDGDIEHIRIDTVLSQLRSSSKPWIVEAIRRGYQAWCEDGHDPESFRNTRLKWSDEGTERRGIVRTYLSA